jgi:hypothetical protein
MIVMNWSRTREVAVHEAGHAVLAFLLNRPFRYVTIGQTVEITKSGLEGAVIFRGGWMPSPTAVTARARRLVEQMVLVYHAGRHTQELWYQRISHRSVHAEIALSIGGRYDQNAAVLLAARLIAGDDVNEISLCEAVVYVEALRPRMRDLVTLAGPDYWFLVEGLADELIEHTTLSWQRVRRVLQRVARSGVIDLSALAARFRSTLNSTY